MEGTSYHTERNQSLKSILITEHGEATTSGINFLFIDKDFTHCSSTNDLWRAETRLCRVESAAHFNRRRSSSCGSDQLTDSKLTVSRLHLHHHQSKDIFISPGATTWRSSQPTGTLWERPFIGQCISAPSVSQQLTPNVSPAAVNRLNAS